MKGCFSSLREKHAPKNHVTLNREFDAWHSHSCKTLIAYYSRVLRKLAAIARTVFSAVRSGAFVGIVYLSRLHR